MPAAVAKGMGIIRWQRTPVQSPELTRPPVFCAKRVRATLTVKADTFYPSRHHPLHLHYRRLEPRGPRERAGKGMARRAAAEDS
jgi:hypothetical protein